MAAGGGGDFLARIAVEIDAGAATAQANAFISNLESRVQQAIAALRAGEGSAAGGAAVTFGTEIARLEAAYLNFRRIFESNPNAGAFPARRLDLGEGFGTQQRFVGGPVQGLTVQSFDAILRRSTGGSANDVMAATRALEETRAQILREQIALDTAGVEITTAKNAAEEEVLTVLQQHVVSARTALEFEQAFAASLEAGAGEAATLVEINAQAAVIGRRRNAIMQYATEEESRRLGTAAQGQLFGPYDKRQDFTAPLVHEQDQAAAASSLRAAESRQSLAAAVLREAELVVAGTDAEEAARLADLEAFAIDAEAITTDAARRVAFRELWEKVQLEEIAAHEKLVAAYTSEALRRQRNAEIANATALATAQVGGGGGGAGDPTRYQQFQAALRGNDPLQNKTLGNQLGGQFLHTAGFLVAGTILFGLLSQLHSAIEESTKLTKEFGIIQSILRNVGDSQAFEGIKSQVLELSTETAVAADKVANAERVLAGVFANKQGVPDFGRAAVEARTVLQTAQVTGEAVSKLENQLTAISLSFSDNGVAPAFAEIVNYSLALEQSLGTGSAEILEFTAAMAPLANELGFTVKQLEGLGAVMAKVSGQSASTLSEQLQRILAGLGEKLPQLTQVLGSNEATKGLLGPIGEAFGAGRIPDVLKILVENFDKLNQVQLNNLALMVGGRREAGTFFSLLAKAPETLKALNEGFATTGTELETRFTAVTQTIGFQFEKTKIEFQKFALAVLDSGLADGIVLIARAFGLLFEALSFIVTGLSDLNNFLGGLPGQFVGTTVAVLALAQAFRVLLAVMQTVALTNIGAAVLGERAVAGLAGARIGSATAALGGAVQFSAAQIAVLQGGVLPGFGASGGVGGAAGLVGAAAIPAALLAAFLPHTEIGGVGFGGYFSTQASLAKQGTAAEQRALQALQAGQSEASLRRSGDQGIAFGVSERLGFHGDINEPIDRAVKRFNQPAKSAVLDALSDVPGTTDDDRKRLHDLAQKLQKNPTNEAQNLIADAIIAQAEAANDPALAETIKNAKALPDLDAKAKAALAALGDPQNVQSIKDLQASFDRGDIGSSAVNALLTQEITSYNDVIDGLKRAGASASDPNLLKLQDERDKLRTQLDTNVRGTILGQQQFAQKLQQALGTGTDPNADYARAVAIITDTTEALRAANQLNAADLQNAYFGILQAQAAQRKALAAQARDPLERLRIEAAPQEIPVEARRYTADAQLRDGPGAKAAEAYSKITHKSIEQSRADIVNVILFFNGDMAKVADHIAKVELDVAFIEAQHLVELGKSLGRIPLIGKAIQNALDIDALKLIQAAKGASVDNGGLFNKLVVPSVTTPDQTAFNDGVRQRQQDLANARVAVARALAGGDPQADANLDLQLAEIEAAYANTPVDRLNAQAHRIDALKKIREANQGLVEAQRDVAVATGGDDPISAAKTALDNANDAVAQAQGPTAQAVALAAQIRAQRTVAKTVQDLADAQLAILLAMDNAAGDTVKAARDAVDGLRQKLNNAAALGLGDTDKANLQAQIISGDAAVRDAQVSSQEQAIQTALTLKRITKGQAIAMLQSIKSIPELNQKQIDEIDIEIAQLREQLGADFKLNLPNKLHLPTLYEVRRLAQGGAGAYDRNVQGGSTIVTNNITINAATNASPQLIANAVTDAIGDPRRNGTYAKRYGG